MVALLDLHVSERIVGARRLEAAQAELVLHPVALGAVALGHGEGPERGRVEAGLGGAAREVPLEDLRVHHRAAVAPHPGGVAEAEALLAAAEGARLEAGPAVARPQVAEVMIGEGRSRGAGHGGEKFVQGGLLAVEGARLQRACRSSRRRNHGKDARSRVASARPSACLRGTGGGFSTADAGRLGPSPSRGPRRPRVEAR